MRRLVIKGDLQDEDYDDLTAICKSAYGLEERREVVSLAKAHIPASSKGEGAIKLWDNSPS